MKSTLRHGAAALTAAALALSLSACKPGDKAAETAAPAVEGASAETAIPGLATEKAQASYMIGMDIGESLKPIQDEIDLDVVVQAVEVVLDEGKPLLSDEQRLQVREAFSTRLQARRAAEMEAKAKGNLAAGEAFLAANAEKPGVQTTASGLQYQVLTQGKGPKPAADAIVKVHYKGSLLDGTEFDSSYERKEPATIPLNQVVPGWQEGIALMPVGSKYTLWIPSKLAYGEQGTPGGPIGPNATLVFEVELLEIVEPATE